MIETVRAAKLVAKGAHQHQKYGDLPFFVHLKDVARIVEWFDPKNETAIAAAWLHDILEDCPLFRYEDLAYGFGPVIADTVLKCTGEGKNRKERQAHILSRLPGNPNACLVKAADRLANMIASRENPGLGHMYLSEFPGFLAVVKPYIPSGLVDQLNEEYHTQKRANISGN